MIDALFGPWASIGPNAYVVVGTQSLALWALFRPETRVTRELRVVQAAYAVLLVFILNQNASSFGLPSFPKVEWIGFTIFLAGLGYATAVRMFEGERRLVALAQEMETAGRIQASILPRVLPRLSGISLAVRYLPMTAVAGDFYDFVVREDGLGVLIADVSGHGVPAALVASMVKVAFAAQDSHAEDPGRVLAGVNRTLCGSLDGTFVTAAYAWLDLGSLTMTYAAAGHPPLLLRGASGVERLSDNGVLMGLKPEAEYPLTRRILSRGDRILFYTDGAVEATSPRGEHFELERLSALLESARDPVDDCAERILRGLAAWRGGTGASDDLTLLVLDIDAPAPSPAEPTSPQP
jgi:sigma-B regulation protein RsbU (phosphoserine phosphatase)